MEVLIIRSIFYNAGKSLSVFNDQLLIYTKENGGLSDARNYGIQHIDDADYVYFMDSDDMIHPDLLKDTVQFADKSQLDYVKFDYFIFDDPELVREDEKSNKIWDVIKKLKKNPQNSNQSYVEVNSPHTNIFSKKEFAEHFNNVGVWDCLINAKILLNGGNPIYFPKGYIHEDLIFDAELFTHMSRFGYIHKLYYFYRQREGSITSSELSKKKAQHSIESVKHNFQVLNQLKDENQSDESNLAIINKIFGYNIWLAQIYFPKQMLISLYDRLGYSKAYIAKYLLKDTMKKSLHSIKKGVKNVILKIPV